MGRTPLAAAGRSQPPVAFEVEGHRAQVSNAGEPIITGPTNPTGNY